MTFYQVIWFFLVGVLLTGFAILDGFDLGVGVWYLKSRGDAERRTLLNAIGPVWDGNEVWLITGGGAIFAAFPPVYATVFSGFYLAMMLLVLCLVARAVSLEFRSKEKSPKWRVFFDGLFSISSGVAVLLFGVALGNILRGIPLADNGDYSGTFLELLNPYALSIGFLGLTMIGCHGANFIHMKAVGELEQRARSWGFFSGLAYFFLFLLISIATWIGLPHLTQNFRAFPFLWCIPLLSALSVIGSSLWARRGASKKAIIASGFSIAGMMGIVGASLFPKLVPASNDLNMSLTLSNASSSELTLKSMFLLAVFGMPLVLGYTIWVYRAFRGKVDIVSPSNHY